MSRSSYATRRSSLLAVLPAFLASILLLRYLWSVGFDAVKQGADTSGGWREGNTAVGGVFNASIADGERSPPVQLHVNKRFGTKARYYAPPRDSHFADVPEHCELVHLHLLVRHGTRNPRAGDIAKFRKLEAHLRKHRQPHWPEWLVQWRNPYVEGEANALVAQGWRELAELAKRDVGRYKRWLGDTPGARHAGTWYASSSSAQTVNSARAYGSVFSGRLLPKRALHLVKKKDDKEISITDACPRWLQLAADKSPIKKTLAPFKKRYLPKILKRISRQLQMKVGNGFYKIAVKLCSYEYAHLGRVDAWCELLQPGISSADDADNSDDVVEGLDYSDFSEDVSRYFKSGGGRPLNERIGCLLLSRILEEMQAAAQSTDPRIKSHIRFGHVGTITVVLTQLGMYEEKPDLLNHHRQFRMSRISPFAANLRFELLRCQGKLSVRTLLNETPIRILGCPSDTDLCPWPIFASILKNRIGHWDYDELCRAVH
ncbi:histidine phosphatase superfamily [Syncephalis pseudoplumigaleata]|uniref:Multiple inositol polyphosphate phosphatase 1 n=1 Tax=Syncephalis pseudoplumigaleata TaxID=1712513 RepID=A0A4P9Z1W4_9FUNG|nr:histidine phosphatase superfamily [Syncephalis pseudoplumigaleata]|eukprot:RKP25420.1 histidine phosphatase superfamily [Syncephalis pseudoplumigaleata]